MESSESPFHQPFFQDRSRMNGGKETWGWLQNFNSGPKSQKVTVVHLLLFSERKAKERMDRSKRMWRRRTQQNIKSERKGHRESPSEWEEMRKCVVRSRGLSVCLCPQSGRYWWKETFFSLLSTTGQFLECHLQRRPWQDVSELNTNLREEIGSFCYTRLTRRLEEGCREITE